MDGARAELYIDTGDDQRNLSIFDELKSKESDIATAFPGDLIWQDLPGKRACRISVQYHDYGLNDEEHWGDIADFLGDKIAALMKVFKPLLGTIMKG
jgi:hypothetical protein